jgi:hypothetical protein
MDFTPENRCGSPTCFLGEWRCELERQIQVGVAMTQRLVGTTSFPHFDALAGVPASQLGPALMWLNERGHVPIERLAGVFGLTQVHVRQLLYRERQQRQQPAFEERDVASFRDAKHSVRRRIRSDEDSTLESMTVNQRVNELLAQVQAIHTEFAGSREFLEAARRLKRLQQFSGFPSNRRWLRFMARVYRERAWFLLHSGHSGTAIAEANCAIEALRLAYRLARTGHEERDDLSDVATSALILSQAFLLQQRPRQAFGALELVEDALEAGHLRLGSDFYRQRGVALLQVGEADREAQRYFAKSAQLMEDLGEATRTEELRYTGARHIYFMNRDWEHAAELAHDIADPSAFGSDTLHASVGTHWAVATGLSVDSSEVHSRALDLLERNATTARAFGHQHTLYALFRCTLALQLTPDHRATWVRRALYLNAFRNR